MAVNLTYKVPTTNSGTLRTPVHFFKKTPSASLEPNHEEMEELFDCFAEVYNPSMKDMEIMKSTGTKEAVTLRIRDTAGEYTPTNRHYFTLEDYRYVGKVFNIVDVAPDLTNNMFVKIIGGYTS